MFDSGFGGLTVAREMAKALPDSRERVVDRLVSAGMKAILNFAPVQIHVPADVALKTVNMAMELEGLSFALTNRD